ncbi:MAG: hypothetical protein ABIH42_03080, partial [Planctomycetota bacterium]
SIQLSDSINSIGKKPVDLSKEEVIQIVNDFVKGIANAKKAGADMVEFHAAHSSTLADFLSKAGNKREDQVGGDVKGRSRIVVEIIKRAKANLKENLVLGIIINGEDFVFGGNTLNDSIAIAKHLEESGVDFIHVSAGARKDDGENSYSMMRSEPSADFPDACNMYLAEAIKDSVDVPVIGGGKIPSTKDAEVHLAEGRTDLISMGRALFADAKLIVKEKAGKFDEVVKCTYCNECVNSVRSGQQADCPQWKASQFI